MYDFVACLLLCLASYFSFFVFLFVLFLFFFPSTRYVYLRVPSSVQQPSATLSKYVVYSTCYFCLRHLYPTPSRHSFVFLFVYEYVVIFFRSSYFSGGVFLFVVLSYRVR